MEVDICLLISNFTVDKENVLVINSHRFMVLEPLSCPVTTANAPNVTVSAANRLIGEVIQSQRLGLSPGRKRLALSFLRHYQDTMLNR